MPAYLCSLTRPKADVSEDAVIEVGEGGEHGSGRVLMTKKLQKTTSTKGLAYSGLRRPPKSTELRMFEMVALNRQLEHTELC